MDDKFKCEGCNGEFHIRHLNHRDTEPGDYCEQCATLGKCACCGELSDDLTFKRDVQNYICGECLPNYKEVAAFIEPLTTKNKAA